MSKTKLLLAGALLLLSCASCASHRTQAQYPDPRPLARDIPAYHAPAKIRESDTRIMLELQPKGTLTLQQALTLALLRNPELAAFSYEVRASEAQALQASQIPNPEVGAEMENFGGSGTLRDFEQTESTFQLSQLWELGGKRKKRTAVAALEGDLAAWDYESKRLDVLTEVKNAFVDVLSAQDRVALTEELHQLTKDFLDVISMRVEVGKSSPAEESKARVALSNSQIKLQRARRQLEASRKLLSASWGSPTPLFERVEGELDTLFIPPEIEQLIPLLINNPEIERWSTELKQRQANLVLQKARRIPDPSLSVGLRRLNETGDNGVVAGVSVPLPVFNRNQGGIEKAEYRLIQAKEQRQAAAVQVNMKLAEAYQIFSSSHQEAFTLKTDVLPEAQAAYEIINEGYSQGRFTFLDVLDTQRTLFDSRIQFLEALTEYHKAMSDLERLIGQRIDTVLK